jgi:hypothetical protein
VGYELTETIHCMNGTKKDFRLVVNVKVRRQREPFEGKVAVYFCVPGAISCPTYTL